MKRKIVICMGSSCFARGNEENLRVIEDFLKSNNLQAPGTGEPVGCRLRGRTELDTTEAT